MIFTRRAEFHSKDMFEKVYSLTSYNFAMETLIFIKLVYNLMLITKIILFSTPTLRYLRKLNLNILKFASTGINLVANES